MNNVQKCLMIMTVYLAPVSGAVYSQDDAGADWQSQVRPRLEAINERGEFRGQSFRGDWLPNSSAYRVEGEDPRSHQSLVVTYDVQTGQRDASLQPQIKQTEHGPLLSPDGKQLRNSGLRLKTRAVP